MVKTALTEMEAHLPAAPTGQDLLGESPAKFVQETKEMKDVLVSESESLTGVMDQVSDRKNDKISFIEPSSYPLLN